MQRFHAESSENFTLLEETVLSHRHPNENEDTGCRRDGHSAHSAHLGMRWVPGAQMEEGHHNGRLFGAACLLRQRGPYFDQRERGRHI